MSLKVNKLLVKASIGVSLMCSTPVMANENARDDVNVASQATTYIDSGQALSIYAEIGRQAYTGFGDNVLKIDPSRQILIFDNEVYNSMMVEERKEYISFVLEKVKSSNLKPKDKNKIYNFIENQDSDNARLLRDLEKDVTADISTGRYWFEPFSGPVSTIMGIIALLVFILLGISVVLDLAYLVLPVVRFSLEKEGTRNKFISAEAYAISHDDELMDSGRSVGTYFRRRAMIMAMVGLCLGYLSTGYILKLVGFIVDVMSIAFNL